MLNTKNIRMETPLHLAILSKSFPATEYCLNAGADISAVTFQQETALHLAARSGNMNIVEALLKRQLKVDATNSQMQTPLFYAIEGGHTYVVERLLNSGADVNHCDIEVMSPLLLAAKKGHVDICQMLVERGAELIQLNDEMESCLMLAVLGKHNDVVEFVLQCDNSETLLELADHRGDSPLHEAVRLGSIQMTKMLISQGARVLAKNVQEHTALHVAAIHGRFGIIQLLLDHTPIIAYERDVDGNFAVHLAAKHGNLHVLRRLLSAAPQLNETNSAGRTPLCFAAENNRLDCVRYLLDQGTDVNHKDNSNITPLFLACCSGHVDVVNELLKAGAKPGFRVHENHPLYPTWNALDVAVDSRKHSCAQAILKSNLWESVLRGVAIAEEEDLNTSLRRMICNAPVDAELALSRCVTKNTVPAQSNDFEITFNFQPLENSTPQLMGSEYEDNSFTDVEKSGTFMDSLIESAIEGRTKSANLHPVLLMLKRGRESLLNHPLVIALISLKWARFFFIYYAYLLMYALFLALFTSFMLQTKAPYMIRFASGGSADTNTLCEKLRNASAKAYRLHIGVPKYGSMVIAVANLLVELFQMIVFKLDYISVDNFLELGIYSLALITTLDFSYCMQTTGLRTIWQWATGIVGIFLAWINLLLYARRDSKLGIFVIMFLMVMKTFFKFIAVFSPFLIAFTLSFHMLLANHVPFSRVHFAFIKTFSMAIGELDTNSIFFDQYGNADAENIVYYEVITYIVFVAFVTIMTIIMMNLLVGLAVDDIKEVRRKAAIIREEMKIDLIFSAESVLNHFRQFIRTPDEYVYRPNDCHGLMEHMFRYFYESAVRTVQEVSETDVAQKEGEEDDTETQKKPEEVLQELHQLTLHIGKLLNRLVDRVNEGGIAESRNIRPPMQSGSRAGPSETDSQTRRLMTTTMLSDSQVPSRIERLHIDEDVDEEPFEFS
ncbi:transient receptor potential cation channel subfamily A member 1 [Paragonimus westermani]|uniref:Transient receptor potential cation channel subfamily A member 1 n=1 Tax=Paragonimus westermani TaxID=34504 RepID=A0A5J4NEM1_9TREM|nr:transient receptor potential cation channel subfamily A member 1 [Paragonimus westermani]